MGFVVWPMIYYEADDALASAANKAAQDERVRQVFICTPDKDLGQCVAGTRVVQLDRMRSVVRDEAGVLAVWSEAPINPGLPGGGWRQCRWLPGIARVGNQVRRSYFVALSSPRRHSKRLASLASINP
jgi:hypothetical protein